MAFDRLAFAIRSRAPITILTGLPGLGRSTLLQELAAQKWPETAVALLDARNLLSGDPYRVIFEILWLAPVSNRTGRQCGSARTYARRGSADGAIPVLLVDDADQLSEAALPLLAFIAGGVAGPVKLKFILAGKPDLFEWLHERLPDIVGPTFELTEMSEADSADYIRHFLKAGGIDEARFDDEALADICRRARGVPLRINAVCQSCLDKATEEGLDRIDAVVVRKAIITLGIRGLAGDSGGR